MGIEIRFYRPVDHERTNFESIGITMSAQNITRISRLYEPGAFSFDIPFSALYADKLAGYVIVLIDRSFWGIIDDLRFYATQGGLWISVRGRDLKGVTASRIIIPPGTSTETGMQGFDAQRGTTEKIMKHYIVANMIDTPLQPNRKVPGLLLAEDMGRGIAEDRYSARHQRLDNVLMELGQASGLGYDIVPDLASSQFIFDIIEGADRSGTQSDRPRVIFDLATKTVVSQEFTASLSESRNAFYATMSGAEFADETLTMMYIRDGEDEQQGIYRRELHMDISAETPIAGDEYNELRRYALIEAENHRPVQSFQCEILERSQVYGKDYFLGDTVTVQNKVFGVTMHRQLLEMTIEYGNDGIKKTATFGRPKLDIFGRLRKQINQGGI